MSKFVNEVKKPKDSRQKLTKERALANSLLNNKDFLTWAGDVMVRNGFFDSREATPYSQGVRGGIVKEIERLLEYADEGDKHLGAIFKEQILSKRGY